MDSLNDPRAKAETTTRRRRFLQVIGVAGLIGAAGCLGDDDDEADDADDTADVDDTDDADDTDDSDDDAGAAVFQVSGFEPGDATVGHADTFEVSAEITNTGDGDGTKDVDYRVDDEVIDSEAIQLEQFESDVVAFDIDASELGTGEFSHGIYTEDDEATGTLTVEPPAELDDSLIGWDGYSFNDTITLSAGENEIPGTLDSSYDFEISDIEVELSIDGDNDDYLTITAGESSSIDSIEAFGSEAISVTIDADSAAHGEEFTLDAEITYTDGHQDGEFEESQPLTVFDEEEQQFYWSANDFSVGDDAEDLEDYWEAMAGVESVEIGEDDDGNFLRLIGEGGERTSLRFIAPGESSLQLDFWVKAKAVDEDTDQWVYGRSSNEDDPGNISATRFDDYHAGDEHRIAEWQSGSFSDLTTRDHLGIEVLYEMHGEVVADDARASWWESGGDEPDEWDLEASPASDSPGWVGLGHWNGEDWRVYEFGVGIGGAEAPRDHVD